MYLTYSHPVKKEKNNIKQLSYFLSTILLTVVLIGCSGGSSGTDYGNGNGNGNGGNNEPAPDEVWMVGQSFTPGEREVEVGTTVTWINQSSEIHTVTSGEDGEHNGMFDSGNIEPDEEYSYTFDEVGTFDYYCIPHFSAGMTGTIIVTESE